MSLPLSLSLPLVSVLALKPRTQPAAYHVESRNRTMPLIANLAYSLLQFSSFPTPRLEATG